MTNEATKGIVCSLMTAYRNRPAGATAMCPTVANITIGGNKSANRGVKGINSGDNFGIGDCCKAKWTLCDVIGLLLTAVHVIIVRAIRVVRVVLRAIVDIINDG